MEIIEIIPSFEQIVLREALKIIKKAGALPDKRQQITKDVHNTEIKDAEVYHQNSIGNINDFPIVKSKHVGITRDGETESRDSGVKDATIIKAIKKAIKKGFSKKSGKTLITFKNKKKLYDMIIVAWENNAIVIITIIQGNRKNPKEYFTPARSKHTKITTESFGYKEILSVDTIILT